MSFKKGDEKNMILKNEFLNLIYSFNVGDPIAEHDTLLNEARVETPIFTEIFQDKIDLVRGTKGSGKSALFLIFKDLLANHFLNKKGVVFVDGVEPQGDPIFLTFRQKFEQLDELEFQNFWRVYIFSLINRFFINSPKFEFTIKKVSQEVEEFRTSCKRANIPLFDEKSKFDELVRGVLNFVCGFKIKQTCSADGSVNTSLEFSPKPSSKEVEKYIHPEAETPIFVSETHAKLVLLLEKAELKVWVLLDRLDEAFLRRSPVEKTAIRSLLQTLRSFVDPRIRIKVFLRDDIFSYVTTGEEGFANLSHVMNRSTQILKWTKMEILHLIVKRVFCSKRIAAFYAVDSKKLENDENYRLHCFYMMFPAQIEPGPKQSSTLDWIYSHCQDSNGVVTPRDVIDLLRFSRTNQEDIFNTDPMDQDHLISPAAFKKALHELSNKKRDSYLAAEFPHFFESIKRFEGSKSEYDSQTLKDMFGSFANQVVDNLCSIGFLKRNDSGTYAIPFLFRHGLKIRQGKYIKKQK